MKRGDFVIHKYGDWSVYWVNYDWPESEYFCGLLVAIFSHNDRLGKCEHLLKDDWEVVCNPEEFAKKYCFKIDRSVIPTLNR